MLDLPFKLIAPGDDPTGLKRIAAICLDLDNTVRTPASGHWFPKWANDWKLMENVEEILWEWRDNHDVILCGVTNQGGVAWGYHSWDEVKQGLDYTWSLFERNPFHVAVVCVHAPGSRQPGLNVTSLLRKPNIGMLALCEHEAHLNGYSIDWDASLVVGDRPEDEEMAFKADVSFMWAHEFFGREAPLREADV